MAVTETARMKLDKPDDSEQADVAVINANMDKLESFAPNTEVTSLTRPATPFPGQAIYETDSGWERIWDGQAGQWSSTNALQLLSSDPRPIAPLVADQIFEVDTGVTRTWDGTRWRALGRGKEFYREMTADIVMPQLSINTIATAPDLFGLWPLLIEHDSVTPYDFEVNLLGFYASSAGTGLVSTDQIAVYIVYRLNGNDAGMGIVSYRQAMIADATGLGRTATIAPVRRRWTPPLSGTYEFGVRAAKVVGATTSAYTIQANATAPGIFRVSEV